MGCTDCGKHSKVEASEPQHAVRFRAVVYQGVELRVFTGTTPDDFKSLPDLPALTLGFRIEFEPHGARTSSGRRWIYCVEDANGWTLDDDDDLNIVGMKYPGCAYKPGGTVPESVMEAVNKLLMETM